MKFFTKKEIKALTATVLIIAFAFGFDDKRATFELWYWATNFIRISFIVAVAFLAKETVRKLVAKAQGFRTEYDLWKIETFKFKPEPFRIKFLGKKIEVKSLPLGAIISVLTAILSAGKLFFVAVGKYNLVVQNKSRFGRKTVHISDYNEAKIAVTGPLTNVALMIIFQLFNKNGMFDQFVFINGMIAIFHMIPFSTLDGAKIFFGSKLMYVSSLVFILGTVLLINTLPPIITLALAAIFGAIFTGVYYYYRIYK